MTSLLEKFAVATPIGDLRAIRVRPRGEARGIALIVPGFTGRADDYVDVQTDAAAHGWQTVAFSQRGQRGSAAPRGAANYSLTELAADVVRVAETIGGGRLVHVVGHSLGGHTAREAVVTHPDGFASLTLFCSGPGALPESHAGGPELEAGAHLLRETIDRTAAVVATHVPVLVAHGDADDVWSADEQYDMAVRLGAEYRVIPGAGHLPNIDNPAATARFLSEFWAEF